VCQPSLSERCDALLLDIFLRKLRKGSQDMLNNDCNDQQATQKKMGLDLPIQHIEVVEETPPVLDYNQHSHRNGREIDH